MPGMSFTATHRAAALIRSRRRNRMAALLLLWLRRISRAREGTHDAFSHRPRPPVLARADGGAVHAVPRDRGSVRRPDVPEAAAAGIRARGGGSPVGDAARGTGPRGARGDARGARRGLAR